MKWFKTKNRIQYRSQAMQNYPISCLLAALLFLSASCERKAERNLISGKVSIEEKSISLALGPQSTYQSNCMMFSDAFEKPTLAILNSKANRLEFYDIEAELIYDSIQFQYSGPNATGRIYGFEILNRDSILVLSQKRLLYLVNRNGGIVSQYDYLNVDAGIGILYRFSATNQPLIRSGQGIIGYKGTVGDWSAMTQQKLNAFDIEMYIDLKTGETELVEMKYPRDYLNGGPKILETSRVFDGRRFVYSFSMDPHLYVTEDFESIRKVSARSKFEVPFESLPPNIDVLSYQRYQLNNFFYRSIIYDQYRQLFYRICDHPIDNVDLDESLLLQNRPSQSIIVLDKNLEIVKEIELPRNKYKADNNFVSPEGLFISENSELNPSLNENIWNFCRIEVE